MSLTLTSRSCGDVFILDCVGRIMAGHESMVLEQALEQAEQEHCSVVLNLSKVTRMDSMGLGLLVRHAHRLQSRKGAIRLAEAQPFVTQLIGITKLSDFLKSYATEKEALESFLGSQPPPVKDLKTGPTLLVFDQSPDLCAFVRTVLAQHGFHVKAVCSLRDAKVLLCCDTVDYILVGPCTAQLSSQMALKELKSLAPKASALELGPEFHAADAAHSAERLLQMMGVGSGAA